MKSILIVFGIFIAGMSSLTGQTTHSGEWDADSFFISFEGSWKIEKIDGKTYVVIGEDFKTKKAPDLKIYLSKLNYKDIDADNASNSDTSVFVAQLDSYKGSKKYLVPSSINISDYKTILVYCKKYAKYWGGSPLK